MELSGCVLCSYICRTDPADVARVDSKTYIVTEDKFETLPRALEGATVAVPSLIRVYSAINAGLVQGELF